MCEVGVDMYLSTQRWVCGADLLHHGEMHRRAACAGRSCPRPCHFIGQIMLRPTFKLFIEATS